MKNIISVLLITGSLFLYSCRETSQESKETDVKLDTLLTKETVASIDTALEFDVLNFKEAADSIFTTLQGNGFKFHLAIDTLNLSELNETELNRLPTGYLVKNSKYCIKYNFNLDSPNRDFGFYIIQSLFTSTQVTDSSFLHLKYLANDDLVAKGGLPGLTYTNDCVLKQALSIYWLNTSCKYSFENHKKYSDFLRKSLASQNIADSIWCKCGAVNCK